jgi:hypothetical protein
MSETVTVPPSAIRPEVIDAVRLVGKIVTYRDQQYKIYSVEGIDFYAFGSKTPGDNNITVDLNMTRGFRTSVYAYIIPTGCVVGEGYGQEIPLEWITPGVCLAKQGQSVWH